MKKIHLSIPKPCHEDWDAMTQADKGRFCGSCQKTVIDFTGMSDRQLIAFFKKPPSSVCGRVYNDQLHRDIVIPGKRIPWMKYFFQFTWPAFVLFLKSCGVKDNVKGKVKIESGKNISKQVPIEIVGTMFPEITPVDTSKPVAKKPVVKGELMGDVQRVQEIDSVETVTGSIVQEIDTAYKPMDTVFIQAYETKAIQIMMGGISVCRVETVEQEKDSAVEDVNINKEIKFAAYPNPVRAGSSLNVSFESSEDLPQLVQLLSSSGQLISQLKQNEKGLNRVINLQIPSNVSSGIYFLQMVTKNKEVKTTKIIVEK